MRSGRPASERMAKATFAAACVLFVALTASATAQTLPSTQAPTTVKSGDWETRCESPPGAQTRQCAVIQTLLDHERPNLSLVVIALKTADRKNRLLHVIVPLGSLIPAGLGLTVDGNDMGRIGYIKCLPSGCVAETTLDDRLLKALEDGKKLDLVVFNTPEEGIGVTGSLAGFKEAFEALP